MNCPHCQSSSTSEREGSWLPAFPVPGVRAAVQRATALNQVPTDIMFLFWRLRYKLSLRDLAEMFLIRGLVFTHEAVRDWEAKLAPRLAVRKRRAGNGAGTSMRPSTTPSYDIKNPIPSGCYSSSA